MKFRTRLRKVHLGCGQNFLEGWDNLDIEEGDGVIVHDLHLPLPYGNETAGVVFSEHVIEHLDKESGYRLLEECHRILSPGGVLRIGWPDLSLLIDAYLERSSNYREFVLPYLLGINKTGDWDEVLSDCLFSWEHRYAYTRKHLSGLLASIGFVEIASKGFRESDHGIVMDVRDDPPTTYLEAVKR